MSEQSEPHFMADTRLGWFEQARFGLFIHWGAYSVAGMEASWPIMTPDLAEPMFGVTKRISEDEYVHLPQNFNPVDFDARQWVWLAKDAGMRYIIITSKHHDGFCMFDAPGTDYKITRTPFGRDVCQELAQACAEAGMPLGFYYSPPDMHHPGYRDTRKPVRNNWQGEPKRKEWGEYLDYMESHIRKLLTDYGKISILWFDGLTNHGKYNPPRFHKLVHELSPETLINDRLGEGYDYITPEQSVPRHGIPTRSGKPLAGNDPDGDTFFRLVTRLYNIPGIHGWLRRQMEKYGRGELELAPVYQERHPSPQRFQPWETCMTMGRTWAYNPEEKEWKPPRVLLRTLVSVVSRGGNFLLNIGPTAQGTFPPEAVERLERIGQWIKAHHQGIYGATYSALPAGNWGAATRQGNKLYLHLFEKPASGVLVLDGFPGNLLAVRQAGGETLLFTQQDERVTITLGEAEMMEDEMPVLEVDIDPGEAGWQAYSQPEPDALVRRKYIQTQARSSFVINAVLNGLLAFLTYVPRTTNLSYGEAAVDILITVAIITYLTAGVVIGAARKEVKKMNLRRLEKRLLRLPKHGWVWALVIMLVATVLFGGVFLDGLIYLLSPEGLAPWVYFLLKTVYTGASGALASFLAIWSVLVEKEEA